jgi:ankyrin repeat protein
VSMFVTIKNATPSDLGQIKNFKETDEDGQSYLQIAIYTRPDLVPYLLEFDIDIDNQDRSTKSTALHYTLARSRTDLAELILEKGANVNIADKYGNGALWVALFNAAKDYSLVKKIVEKGGDPHHKNKVGKSPFHMAVTRKEDEIIEYFESHALKTR